MHVLTGDLTVASWLRAVPTVREEVHVTVGLPEAYRATACMDSVHQDSVASVQATSGFHIAEQRVGCVQTCTENSAYVGKLGLMGNVATFPEEEWGLFPYTIPSASLGND